MCANNNDTICSKKINTKAVPISDHLSRPNTTIVLAIEFVDLYSTISSANTAAERNWKSGFGNGGTTLLQNVNDSVGAHMTRH